MLGFSRFLIISVGVIALSWFLAFMETWTIESVPYYSFHDRDSMYAIGTTFYALYFLPAFPMFFLLDEDENWDFSYVIINSLAAGMLAFVCLFFLLMSLKTNFRLTTNEF